MAEQDHKLPVATCERLLEQITPKNTNKAFVKEIQPKIDPF
jgi:hypothetical protein